jgi:hypothetical protein
MKKNIACDALGALSLCFSEDHYLRCHLQITAINTVWD